MIETLDDILDELADMAGVYGAHSETESRHCRSCWVSEYYGRIKDAVNVEIKLGTWVILLAAILPAAGGAL